MTSIPTELDGQTGTASLSDHDQVLVVRSLRDKATRLEKLAKTVREEGYSRSAEELAGDAGQIREHIIPDLDPQVDPFPQTLDEARAAIANLIGEECNRLLATSGPDDDVAGRISARLTNLLYPIASEAYNRGRTDGLAERDMQAAGCILQAVKNIREAIG